MNRKYPEAEALTGECINFCREVLGAKVGVQFRINDLETPVQEL